MLDGLAGVSGAQPRLLLCGGIGAVVSEFGEEMVALERENVFRHERVVEGVLRYVTPLPFRFGTLVAAERLENYIESNRAQLIRNLERVRGSVEMSVKVIWDAQGARNEGLKAEGSDLKHDPLASGKGAAYLEAKRREILGDRVLKERAEELAAWLTGRIGGAAKEQKVELRPLESLVIRASYLVERGLLGDYRQRVEEAVRERASLRFLTSGPWPPYSFSNINP